jgi:uncharacterized membrane protein (DUF106 family)
MLTSYIAKVVDVFLSPLLALNPLISLLLVSFFLSLIILLYQRKIFSKEGIIELKRRADEIRENLVKTQNKSKEELEKLMEEMINVNGRLLKENFKVTVLSLFLGIIFFYWISFHYSGYYVKLPIPFFNKLSLVYFYIILSVVLGIVMGKLLEVR